MLYCIKVMFGIIDIHSESQGSIMLLSSEWLKQANSSVYQCHSLCQISVDSLRWNWYNTKEKEIVALLVT